MDCNWLGEQLSAGRSIEAIARDLGKHPSTVAYWTRRCGLRSAHAALHASRGGLARERLEPLVDADMSVREIAEAVGRSTGTVRYWLRRYALKTSAAARRQVMPPGARPERVRLRCRIHGETEFVVRRTESGYRCARCRAEAVAAWRRRAKARLVEEAGGQCRLCGYDRCVAALQFHHLDPGEKRFEVAGRGLARSFEVLRAEASKCALLCANCHAEVEAGFAQSPT